MIWVLEAFRLSDELLAWDLDLPGADQATLAERLNLPELDESGGFLISREQARIAASFADPAARLAVDLESDGLEFFIASFADPASQS